MITFGIAFGLGLDAFKKLAMLLSFCNVYFFPEKLDISLYKLWIIKTTACVRVFVPWLHLFLLHSV